MGLDLYLVQNKEYNGTKWNDDNSIDLAYGRKTWNIAQYFMDRSFETKYQWLYRVPEIAWRNFEDDVERFNLESIQKIVNEHDYDDDITNEELEELKSFVEFIYDEQPTLGYIWEASAILNWYGERFRVREAYKENPDSVYIIASY